MKKRILITKSSGVKEKFSPNKLKQSLIRAGASNLVIKKIEKEICKIIYPGISTKEIYKRAFSLLRKESAHMAAKYKLKKAILELGPSGYPFEKYHSRFESAERPKYSRPVVSVLSRHEFPELS